MTHDDHCEADVGHSYDCATATEFSRLRAYAEAVRDEIECIGHDGDEDGTEHVDDCWHCYAIQALEPTRKPATTADRYVAMSLASYNQLRDSAAAVTKERDTAREVLRRLRIGEGDVALVQSAAETECDRLRAVLVETISQLERWAAESVTGGWSTHQVSPMRREADRLRRVLLP